MHCEIEWNALTPAEWQEKFSKIRRSNILQSYEYALAVCPLKKQRACWGIISIDGQEAGLLQILEVGIFRNLFHAVILDRGPLWFEGFGSDKHFESFLQAFRKQFPKRLGRKMRFIPERSDEIEPLLKQVKFQKQDGQPYQTIWLDLMKSEEKLLVALKKNWRNMLSRAERDGVEVICEFDKSLFKDFLTKYALDKAEKGYDGPNVELVMALSKSFLIGGNLLLARAVKDKQTLGYGLFFIHGKSATYQIGWTSDQGRKIGAQNKLLMDAILALKAKGMTDLDLGGVNDETAKGVKKFKEGMGGELVSYAGLYC